MNEPAGMAGGFDPWASFVAMAPTCWAVVGWAWAGTGAGTAGGGREGALNSLGIVRSGGGRGTGAVAISGIAARASVGPW